MKKRHIIYYHKYKKWVNAFTNKYGVGGGFLYFFGVALLVRFYIVSITNNFSETAPEVFYAFLLHDYLIFLLTIMLLWWFLSVLLHTTPSKLAHLFFLAPFIIILPPLIDLFASGGEGFWSFYLISNSHLLWQQFYSFFGHLPEAITYVGVRIVALIAVGTLTLYTWIRTHSIIRSIGAFFVSYSIFFILAATPSFLAYGYYALVAHLFPSELSLGQITALSVTPRPFFHSQNTSFITALITNLNLVYYVIIMIILALWKWTTIEASTLQHGKKFIRQQFVPIILLTIGLFSILGYHYFAPFAPNPFLWWYYAVALIVWILYFFYFILITAHAKRIDHAHRNLLWGIVFFLFLGASLLGTTLVFLMAILLALTSCILILPHLSRALPVVIVVILAQFFYAIFTPEHSLANFSWWVLAYILILMFISSVTLHTIPRGTSANWYMVFYMWNTILLAMIFHMITIQSFISLLLVSFSLILFVLQRQYRWTPKTLALLWLWVYSCTLILLPFFHSA